MFGDVHDHEPPRSRHHRKHPKLLTVGVFLFICGVATLSYVIAAHTRPPDPLERSSPLAHAASDRSPSRFWPIAAGLALAAGGACIGIGLNRWRASTGVRS